MTPVEASDRYLERIDELLERLKNTAQLTRGGSGRTTVDACFQGTLGMLQTLYGSSSPQVKALLDARKGAAAYSRIDFSYTDELRAVADSVKGTLLNLRDELRHGLIRTIATQASGVVIGDLVTVAKAQLKAGYKDVSAVLAAAALEDAMKRKADELGVTTEGKSLETLINSLKAKSFFKGAQVPIVSSYVKLRNNAMHAEWEKIDDADVSSLIGFLEPFLLQHFS